MLKSANDHKQYRLISLSNGLTALLVSDATSELASAALAVNVGHFNDPIESQGLAHLLEHMLFLGTAKYPDDSEYQSFIRGHGGQNNAWTSSEFTNFFFSIENSYFEPALSRFCEFFISPTLSGQSIAKEISAVDSEFRLKLKDENRRVLAAIKETVNPAHPFRKFSVGNEQTLLNDHHVLESKLKQFYREQYCASKMKLVLCSNESLDQLEIAAKTHFEAIENRNLAAEFPDVDFTLAEQKNLKISIIPDKDVKRLSLNFAMPVEDSWYRSKPLSYIAYLLGHEGRGSLLSQLKSLGFVNSLSAGTGISGYNYKDFSISIGLTDLGYNHKDDIIALVFHYVELIKHQGIDCWRYTEKHSMISAAFEFQEQVRAIDLVSHLVINMFKYQDDDIIFGDYAMESFEPVTIGGCLDLISPDNLRLVIIAPNLTTNKVAPWYETAFSVAPISAQDHERWLALQSNHTMSLPEPNPFIVERLAYSPCRDCDPIPKILLKHQGLRLWHYQNDEFKVPKGHIYTAIDSDFAGQTPRLVALCHLYIEMLHDDLAEMTYPAEIAGMHYEIYPHQAGLTMHVSGYTPKLFLFFEMLITQIRQRNFTSIRFEEIKYQLNRTWQNSSRAKPINLLFQGLGSLLQPKQYPSEQLRAELASITLEELHQFITQLFQQVHLECYVQGDWNEKDVLLFGNSVHQQISAIATPIDEVKRQLIDINNRGTLIREFNSDSSDSAVIIYMQSSMADSYKVALFSLLNYFVAPQFFAEIRTNQQLGYLCGASYMPVNRHPGLMFYIQSPVASPSALVDAIDLFLSEFVEYLAALTDQQWQQGVAGLLTQIEAPDTSSHSRAHRHWLSIGNRDYQFNHRQKIAEQVQHINQIDLSNFVRKKLTSPVKDRLILCCYGNEIEDKQRLTQGHPIRELPLFKRQSMKFTL